MKLEEFGNKEWGLMESYLSRRVHSWRGSSFDHLFFQTVQRYKNRSSYFEENYMTKLVQRCFSFPFMKVPTMLNSPLFQKGEEHEMANAILAFRLETGY